MASALKVGVLTFHKVHQLRLLLASTLPGGASDTPPRAFVLPTGDLHVVGVAMLRLYQAVTWSRGRLCKLLDALMPQPER